MTEIIQREASSCTLTQLTSKLIPEVIGREIEKTVDPTGEIKKVLEDDKPTASAPALPPTPAAPPTPSVPASPPVGNIAANGATNPTAPIPANPPLPETASTPAEAKS